MYRFNLKEQGLEFVDQKLCRHASPRNHNVYTNSVPIHLDAEINQCRSKQFYLQVKKCWLHAAAKGRNYQVIPEVGGHDPLGTLDAFTKIHGDIC